MWDVISGVTGPFGGIQHGSTGFRGDRTRTVHHMRDCGNRYTRQLGNVALCRARGRRWSHYRFSPLGKRSRKRLPGSIAVTASSLDDALSGGHNTAREQDRADTVPAEGAVLSVLPTL